MKSSVIEPALSDASRMRITQYLAKPAHAVLLEGPVGIGLYTIAQYIARMLKAMPDSIQTISSDEKGTITIERIRSLYALTRARQSEARVVIIDDADSMGIPAQNALLKLLEEPTAHTYFILTSHTSQTILPTITSRTQKLTLTPLSNANSEALITTTNASARAQIAFLASGLPAEIVRLQSDASYFSRATELMKDARQFLQGSQYERLVIVNSYSSKRPHAIAFLSYLLKLQTFMLFRQKKTEYARDLEMVDTILARIAANGHIKTQLAYLVTKLS